MGSFSTNWTGVSAGIVIAVVPILTLYLLLQRRIVSGLTAGAIKRWQARPPTFRTGTRRPREKTVRTV